MSNLTLDRQSSFGDEILMQDLAGHDSRALEALYGRYRLILRGVIQRILKDELDTDDVLQEVFLQLWMRSERYSAARGKPLGWLITLARRRAIDRLRQRAAYQRATDRLEFETQLPRVDLQEHPGVELTAFQGDIRELVQSAMLRLPQKQREVVTRAFLGGMSQRAIAAQMEIPLGTVKTRIELGRRKLASVLAGARHKIF